jgi:DNA repair protein RecO (recombination protein O)
MIETSTGLILRTRPLTDTSLIVHWLTRDLGRVATVAKGARRPKSPFAGKLDLFYRARFSFQRSRRSELHRLREVGLEETHAALRRDVTALTQASYCAALVEQTTETETPVPTIFGLMTGVLEQLCHKAPPPQTVPAFELKLLAELGLQPDADREKLGPDIKQILRVLSTDDWTNLSRLKLTPAQLAALDRFLRGFMEYHLGRVPGIREKITGKSAGDPPKK